MAFTNETANLHLPQWIGSDTPDWLTDVNNAFAAIDEGVTANKEKVEGLEGAAVSLNNEMEALTEAVHNNAANIVTLNNQHNVQNIKSTKKLLFNVGSGFGGETGVFIEGDNYKFFCLQVLGDNDINIAGTPASQTPESGIAEDFYIYKEIEAEIPNEINKAIGAGAVYGFNNTAPVKMFVIIGKNGKLYYAGKEQNLVSQGIFGTVCASW